MTEGHQKFDINRTTLPWAREVARMEPKTQRRIWFTHAALASFASCEEEIPKSLIEEAINIAIKTSALKQSEDGDYGLKSGDWADLIKELRDKSRHDEGCGEACNDDEKMTEKGRKDKADKILEAIKGGVYDAFHDWYEASPTVSLLIEVPREKEDALRAAIEAAGGKVVAC